MQTYRQLRHPDVSYFFQTDASDLGWGISCTANRNVQSQGLWRNDQCTLHIDVRELYVVFICLTIFCAGKSAVHITAVSYINHMGRGGGGEGCKSVACDTVVGKLGSGAFLGISGLLRSLYPRI